LEIWEVFFSLCSKSDVGFKIQCQDLDFQTFFVFNPPKFDAKHWKDERINYLSFVFLVLFDSKILLVVQSLTPNIGGLGEFQLLELQGSAPMDDATPSMELP
jgi:hypothetical protein